MGQDRAPCAASPRFPCHEDLLADLYCELGLTYHIGLLCGVGSGTVIARLRRVGLPVRLSGPLCPWLQRFSSSARSSEIKQPG